MEALHDVEAVILAVSWLVCMVFSFMAGQIAAARAALAAKERLFNSARGMIEGFFKGRKEDGRKEQRGIPETCDAVAGKPAGSTGSGSAAGEKKETSHSAGAGGARHRRSRNRNKGKEKK